jgi:tetratricopeptide (TPR) repeat protein
MPETACLHIQARDTDPIRVVELPGTSVRIGRASYCEVRLSEPELAEEECRLRRRGGAWQLVPARRGGGSVRVDGQAIAQPCPIPFDVPFRVGDHWLTLRPTSTADPDWASSYRPTPPMELPPAPRASLEDLRAEPLSGDVPGSGRTDRPSSEAEPDHLSRWQARRPRRDGGPGVARARNLWEDRWKAAGERLRARAGGDAPYRSASAQPPAYDYEPATARLPEAPIPRTGLRERSSVSFEAPPPPVVPTAAPPPSATLGPPRISPAVATGRVPYEPPRPKREHPAASWQEAPLPPRPQPEAWPDPPETRRISPQPPQARAVPTMPFLSPVNPPAEGDSAAVEADAVIVGPFADGPGVAEETTGRDVSSEADAPEMTDPALTPAEGGPDQDLPTSPGEGRGESAPEMIGRAGGVVPQSQTPDEDETAGDAPPAAPAPAFTLSFSPKGRGTDRDLPLPSGADRREDVDDLGAWAYRTLFAPEADTMGPLDPALAPEPVPTIRDGVGAPRRPRRPSGRARRGGTTRPARPEGAPTPEGAGTADVADRPIPGAGREWPSARDIFAANRARPERETASAVGSRRAAQPVPTEAREPEHWAVPLWLGWPVAMAAAIVVGAVGVVLSWTWARDAFAAGQVANRLADGGATLAPLPETIARPDGAWWKTTAEGLVHWAFYLDRADAGKPGTAEEVEALLETASRASPVEPQSSFARARPTGGAGREVPLFRGLGLSRDVVAMSWAGHQLLAAGKAEPALRMYREALEMAGRAEPSRLGAPAFDDDPQVRRYALPHEALIGPVVRDMAETDRWTFSEWSRALPPFAVAPLAAARLLREKGRADDADRALDAVLAEDRSAPPAGTSAAVHLAAQAEALALRSRWDEAEDRYRRAIELMPDDATRRAWWINLAEIALRLNDEAKRQRALEAARGHGPGDEVARRAAEMLKYSGAREDRRKP